MVRRLNEAIRRHAKPLRGLALGLAVLAVLLAARSLPVEQWSAWLTGRADVVGAWGPVLYVLIFVALTLMLLPATPLTIAAGAVFGAVVAALLTSLASTVSAAVAFLAARYLGRDRVARRVRRAPKWSAVYEALRGRQGWKIVVAVRLSHALPFGLQNYLFGLTPIRFGTFLGATWASMLPGAILYTYLGHLGAAALESAPDGSPLGPWAWPVRAAGLAVAAAALLYVAHVARQAVRQMTGVDLADAEEQPPSLPPLSPEAGERGERQSSQRQGGADGFHRRFDARAP